MAYRGTDRKTNHAQYTPISNYSALSAEVRKKLSSMKIDAGQDPAQAQPQDQAKAAQAQAPSAATTDTSAARASAKRAQLSR
jgi:hypothetical protein